MDYEQRVLNDKLIDYYLIELDEKLERGQLVVKQYGDKLYRFLSESKQYNYERTLQKLESLIQKHSNKKSSGGGDGDGDGTKYVLIKERAIVLGKLQRYSFGISMMLEYVIAEYKKTHDQSLNGDETDKRLEEMEVLEDYCVVFVQENPNIYILLFKSLISYCNEASKTSQNGKIVKWLMEYVDKMIRTKGEKLDINQMLMVDDATNSSELEKDKGKDKNEVQMAAVIPDDYELNKLVDYLTLQYYTTQGMIQQQEQYMDVYRGYNSELQTRLKMYETQTYYYFGTFNNTYSSAVTRTNTTGAGAGAGAGTGTAISGAKQMLSSPNMKPSDVQRNTSAGRNRGESIRKMGLGEGRYCRICFKKLVVTDYDFVGIRSKAFEQEQKCQRNSDANVDVGVGVGVDLDVDVTLAARDRQFRYKSFSGYGNDLTVYSSLPYDCEHFNSTSNTNDENASLYTVEQNKKEKQLGKSNPEGGNSNMETEMYNNHTTKITFNNYKLLPSVHLWVNDNQPRLGSGQRQSTRVSKHDNGSGNDDMEKFRFLNSYKQYQHNIMDNEMVFVHYTCLKKSDLFNNSKK
ncbi:hypothetical protein AX774_g1132 [Zancudomyces culisetae]|uniref:Uncharacterized protein n=1 Tax=Zancudomyces culisetae TaxID=1213189 RepID=A0A1R1PWF5_ZANCU|nr:hypothetical protein AX774_g1132 [Zancudomyces culisetae]|eukprot:OMH85326.1 hypothetical protein AX774_g1132 [Zancudomyces culisetae]